MTRPRTCISRPSTGSIISGPKIPQGFHNPTEAARICGDSVAFAEKCCRLLRQALAAAGVAEPADIKLDLAKFLNNRGVKKLNFQPSEEFKDPFGIQPLLTPEASLGLPESWPGQAAAKAPAGKPETAPGPPRRNQLIGRPVGRHLFENYWPDRLSGLNFRGCRLLNS